MPAYTTPGVYYERADAGVPRIAPLRTDVAAFVGIARRGPLHAPLPVESWRQFVAYFGDFSGAAYLAYAVRGFFENGGRRCWIVRVASAMASVANTVLSTESPPAIAPPPHGELPGWSVEAFSPGVWGNDLQVEIRATHRAQTLADPALSTPEYSAVRSVAGFERGTHVRITSTLPQPQYRVVAAIDAGNKRLYWVSQQPQSRLPYEQALTGFGLGRPLLIESIEYTLLVSDLNRLVAGYEGLSLCPAHPRYGPAVLPPLRPAPEEALDWRVPAAPDPVAILPQVMERWQVNGLRPLSGFGLDPIPLRGGVDGLAALDVGDFSGEAVDAFDDDAARKRKRRGIGALEPVSEPALIAVPDIHIQARETPRLAPEPACVPDPCLAQPPTAPAAPRARSVGDAPPRFTERQIHQVQGALVAHCEARRDRLALLDPPYATVRDARLGVADLRAWRRRFDTLHAALHGPWLKVPDPLRLDGQLLRDIPPCGHVAGFIAQTDLAVGVHKAPANGALAWVHGLTMAIDDATHGLLNEDHINAIRSCPGRGLRILGARLLTSDPDWRYLNVRRLLMMIRKAILICSQWAVFEPNHRMTRAKVHLSLTSFLLGLWQRGALAGATAREAFFVNCNEDTTPASARERGQMIAEVGVAPSYPFEFVVLRVGYADNAIEITETTIPGGA